MTTTTRRRGLAAVGLKGAAGLTGLALLAVAGCSSSASPDEGATSAAASGTSFTTREVTDGTTSFTVVTNPGDGAVLSYSGDSGVSLLTDEVDGQTLAFKDMNGNGTLDAWEDWRLSAQERAASLSADLTVEQIAGLMLFSAPEASPADGLTDNQREYLEKQNLRNILNYGPSDVKANVTWVNQMQAFVEGLASESNAYVPVNFSTNPRSAATFGSAFSDAGDGLSQWPSSLGLAAAMRTETTDEFARATSEELRALGLSTLLGPQMDLATEPRWLRVSGTFGENVDLTTDLTEALVQGYQGTFDESGANLGWGPGSVNAMIKHFPGDGVGEGGRESHMDAGKFGVYPGGNLSDHLEPFVKNLDSAAVMTSYSIGVDADGEPLFGELVGTAYDQGKLDLLREENGYDGVVVTDWGVTSYTGWGISDLSLEEKHYQILRTGHDMFGGNNDLAPVLAAHEMWQADFEAGENDVDADTRFRQSGARILTMLFQVGLYEDPYLDLDRSLETVGSAGKVDAGRQAQLDSVVMLKNDGAISATDAAAWKDKTVYVPRSSMMTFSGLRGDGVYTEEPSMNIEVVEKYAKAVVTDEAELDDEGKVVSYTAPDLSDVDLVVVGMRSPSNGDYFTSPGMDPETREFYPLSLQYRPYTADGENVRQVSISGDLLEDGTRENRSYYGATSRIENEADLDAFERAVAAVDASGKDIPVITVLKANNPVVPTEFEAASDAILVGFGISDEALLEVALGLSEPRGRLPIAFPASMDAVEVQLEDVGEDAEPYVDSAGSTYRFGFGLGYSGPITD